MSLFQFQTNNFLLSFAFCNNYIFYFDESKNFGVLKYSFPDQIERISSEITPNTGDCVRNLIATKVNENKFLLTYCLNSFDVDIMNDFVSVEVQIKDGKAIKLEENQMSISYSSKLNKIFCFENDVYLLKDECFLEKYYKSSNEFLFFNELELNESERIKDIRLIRNKDSEIHTVILTEKDNLLVNLKKVASDCSSYYIHKEYILFTISSQGPYDTLHVHSYSSLLSPDFDSKPKEITKDTNWEIRNIEKNALIVLVSESRIVFSLPRGNFETINHRILLLNQISEFVNAKDYYNAFLIIRKNKLNFNLLIDLNAAQFVECVKNEHFFNKLTSEFIDLFILDLSDEVSEEIKYISGEKGLLQNRSDIQKLITSSSINVDSKLNFVCDLFLEVMLKNKEKYMFNVLMVFSKTRPSKLDLGLKMIKNIKDNNADQPQLKKPPHIVMSSQPQQKTLHYRDLLKYFCWLVSAESLYKLALSLYDLELAIMIAEFTNMDPKEYLPYIESLKQIPNEIDFKFKICCDLKLYENALKEGAKVC